MLVKTKTRKEVQSVSTWFSDYRKEYCNKVFEIKGQSKIDGRSRFRSVNDKRYDLGLKLRTGDAMLRPEELVDIIPGVLYKEKT